MEWEEVIVSSSAQVAVPQVPLPQFILARAALFGDRPALVDGLTGRAYSYAELADTVARCSGSLARLGVTKEARVCFFTPNCVEFAIAYFGVMSLGGVVVPLNPLFTKYELQYYVDDCQPEFIISAPEVLTTVTQVATAYGKFKKIIVIDDGSSGHVTFSSLLIGCEPRGEGSPGVTSVTSDVEIDPERDAASLCYSSGTTGRPKGCIHSHFNYICSTLQMIHPDVNFMCEGVDVLVATIPMYHTFGQLKFLCQGLHQGATVVVLPRFKLDIYLRTVERYRATVLALAPPAVHQIAWSTSLRDLTSVRHVVSGAAPLSARLTNQIMRKIPQASIIDEYGMTEVLTGLCSYSPEGDTGNGRRRPTGKLLPSIQAKIVDIATGRTLGPNQDGEIYLRTPARMIGYWRNEAATNQSITADGWLATGDVGHYDLKLNFYVIERIKDLLKYNGYQVSPADLESVLLQHPLVRDAAVVGRRDEVAGDLPTAFVVGRRAGDEPGGGEMVCGGGEVCDGRELSRGGEVSAKDIMDFVAERVSPQKKLRGGVKFLEEIPKSPSGKILRNVLRDMLAKEEVKPKHLEREPEKQEIQSSGGLSTNLLASKL